MNIIKIGLHLLFTLVLYAMGAVVFGIAYGIAYSYLNWGISQHVSTERWAQHLYWFIITASGFFVFGIALTMIVGLLNLLFRLRLKEGDYVLGHPETIKWYFVNAMFLCVRIVFMDFMLLTPLCSLFYRMMGAKLGLGVQINSKNIADLSLLEIGDNSVIGGNATVIGHIFEKKRNAIEEG